MPEKSVKEMNKLERIYYSLQSRTFRGVVLASIIVGLTALLIGLGLYTYALANQYISEAFNLTKYAAGIAEKVIDVKPVLTETRNVYDSLTEEERAQNGSDQYYEHFSHITSSEDYTQIKSILKDFKDNSDVFAVYLGMYDRENERLIYVIDPDENPETLCVTGEFEQVKGKEIEDFYNWDGTGNLYNVSKTERWGWLCTAAYPVYDDSGQIIGFFLSDVTLGDVANGMKMFLLQYAVALFVVVNVLAFLFTRVIKKQLVNPINSIAEAAQNYVNDKREGIQNTNHFTNLNISTGDEIENLSLIMADMEKDLNDYEINLTNVTAEKERIGVELSLANRIQADMLPNIYPAFPDRPEFDIFASMDPAKEVGGDFYDFFLIDERHLGIVMADVSGKGVPAALFMMASKILIQNHAVMGKSPKEVIETVNNQICSNNREEMFITVWFGILDLDTGIIRAVNAGHEYPVLKHPGKDFELIKDKHGFVVGGMSGLKYTEYELALEPGSKLFLYTDGVTEATDSQNRLFGTERLIKALKDSQNGTPYDILKAVDGNIGEFVKEAPQFDDITMLCIHYMGKSGKRMKEITVKANVENISTVTDFINIELESMDCPVKAQMQIDVAIDELFGNIANYAYGPEGGLATVRFEEMHDPHRVVITFKDSGVPYNPLEKEDPDVTLSAEEREIGGLGIFLVKKTMDDLTYENKDGFNILKVTKNI